MNSLASGSRRLTRPAGYRRLGPAVAGGVLCAAAGLALGGCNNGSPVHVEVKGVADHLRVKKVEILSEDGKVVMRADADENGNGRVVLYSADGEVIASLPEGIER